MSSNIIDLCDSSDDEDFGQSQTQPVLTRTEGVKQEEDDNDCDGAVHAQRVHELGLACAASATSVAAGATGADKSSASVGSGATIMPSPTTLRASAAAAVISDGLVNYNAPSVCANASDAGGAAGGAAGAGAGAGGISIPSPVIRAAEVAACEVLAGRVDGGRRNNGGGSGKVGEREGDGEGSDEKGREDGESEMEGEGDDNNNRGGARCLMDEVEAERDGQGGADTYNIDEGDKKMPAKTRPATGSTTAAASASPAGADDDDDDVIMLNDGPPSNKRASRAPEAEAKAGGSEAAAGAATATSKKRPPSADGTSSDVTPTLVQDELPASKTGATATPSAAAATGSTTAATNSATTATSTDGPPTPTNIPLRRLRSTFESLPRDLQKRYIRGLSIKGLMMLGDAISREVLELALRDRDAVRWLDRSCNIDFESAAEEEEEEAAAAAEAANRAAAAAAPSVARPDRCDDSSGGVPMSDGDVHDDSSSISGDPMSDNDDVDIGKVLGKGRSSGNVGEEEDMDDDLRRVLELSKQTAKEEDEQRAKYRRVVASLSPGDGGNSGANNDDDDEEVIDLDGLHIRKYLSRHEFDTTIESIIEEMGGWDKIDNGRLVKAGNSKIKPSDLAAGGGMAQSRAQYGRYTCEGFWRLIDVLEGRKEADLKESTSGGDDENDIEDDESEDGKQHAAASDSDNDSTSTSSRSSSRKRKRLNFLPDTRPILAHVDIGHGIGIQVLQAGLGLGIVSRGVEIMKGRQVVAESIRENLLTCLRRDPPDMSRIELHHRDFSRACLPDNETGKCDEWLRTHLLCRDLSEEEQKGLVIFVNNAQEIFAARSCNHKGISVPLDAHLAELFGNMKVGGRMVTIEDISSHLHRNANWFRKDVFQSGSHATSWDGKSMNVYVLTKLRDDWTCQYEDCQSKLFGGAVTSVVKDDGKLSDACVYCGGGPKRTTRTRRKNAKYSE